jgi:hypothetical protein
MAKKNRPAPASQGSLSDIYKLFFGRLHHLKPDVMSLGEWMEYLFDYKNRDIARFVATKEFTMPGLFYTAGSVKVQGLGYRQVPEGAALLVRSDDRTNTVDVDWMGGQGEKEQVFCLSASEWGWVKLHLKREERRPDPTTSPF